MQPVAREKSLAYCSRPSQPRRQAAPCPPVPAFDSDSWDDLGLAYIELTRQYVQCAARQQAVVGAWPGNGQK